MLQDYLTGREYDFPSGRRELDTVPKLWSEHRRTASSQKLPGRDVRFFRCVRQCSNRWRTSQEERGDVGKYEDQQSEKSGQRFQLNSTTINEWLKEEL
jgi:hypothetical protein